MTKPPPRPIGEALREWRQGRRLSQTQIGDAAGMTQTNVSKIEAGGAMYLDDIVKVEDYFGATRGTILRLSGHVEDSRRPEDCIAADSTLTPGQRQSLAEALSAFRAQNSTQHR